MTHRRFNNWLSLLVVCLGLYLVVTPWLPQIDLWWHRLSFKPPAYAVNLTDSPSSPGESATDQVFSQAPTGHRIVIPSITLESEIFTGTSPNNLNRGPWLRPNGSTPPEGSNTVIAGHRFSYGSNGRWIFYHLDKLRTGDRIGIYWDQDEYIYEVTESKVVPATAVEIESATDDQRLTLYTCTPIWTAENRLVIIAKLIKVNLHEA